MYRVGMAESEVCLEARIIAIEHTLRAGSHYSHKPHADAAIQSQMQRPGQRSGASMDVHISPSRATSITHQSASNLDLSRSELVESESEGMGMGV